MITSREAKCVLINFCSLVAKGEMESEFDFYVRIMSYISNVTGLDYQTFFNSDTWIILDEAQVIYGSTTFWEPYKQRENVIAFASYGFLSKNPLIATPHRFYKTHDLVDILANREEYASLIELLKTSGRLHSNFNDFLYNEIWDRCTYLQNESSNLFHIGIACAMLSSIQSKFPASNPNYSSDSIAEYILSDLRETIRSARCIFSFDELQNDYTFNLAYFRGSKDDKVSDVVFQLIANIKILLNEMNPIHVFLIRWGVVCIHYDISLNQNYIQFSCKSMQTFYRINYNRNFQLVEANPIPNIMDIKLADYCRVVFTQIKGTSLRNKWLTCSSGDLRLKEAFFQDEFYLQSHLTLPKGHWIGSEVGSQYEISGVYLFNIFFYY